MDCFQRRVWVNCLKEVNHAKAKYLHSLLVSQLCDLYSVFISLFVLCMFCYNNLINVWEKRERNSIAKCHVFRLFDCLYVRINRGALLMICIYIYSHLKPSVNLIQMKNFSCKRPNFQKRDI